MYQILKQIAADNNWVYFYGRRDYANLLNEVEDDDKIYLFLDPVQENKEFDEYGEPIATLFSGSFLLLKSSQLDEGYEERYLNDIRPLIETQSKIIIDNFSCSDYSIQSWNSTEVINLFDYGYDGIVVNYSVYSL